MKRAAAVVRVIHDHEHREHSDGQDCQSASSTAFARWRLVIVVVDVDVRVVRVIAIRHDLCFSSHLLIDIDNENNNNKKLFPSVYFAFIFYVAFFLTITQSFGVCMFGKGWKACAYMGSKLSMNNHETPLAFVM